MFLWLVIIIIIIIIIIIFYEKLHLQVISSGRAIRWTAKNFYIT